MRSVIFTEWLKDLNNQFRLQNQKILLLLDNATSHFNLKLNSSDEEPGNSDPEELHSTRSNNHGHGCSRSRSRVCGRGHPKLSNTTPNNQRSRTNRQSKGKRG